MKYDSFGRILIAEVTQKKLIFSKIFYFIQDHFNVIQMNTVCMEYSSRYCSCFGEMDFYRIKWTDEQINSGNSTYFKGENSFPVYFFFIPSNRKRLAYKVNSYMFPVFKIMVSAKKLAAVCSPSVLHILLSLHRKIYVCDFKEKLNNSCLFSFCLWWCQS